jgi:hypothetical protein
MNTIRLSVDKGSYQIEFFNVSLSVILLPPFVTDCPLIKLAVSFDSLLYNLLCIIIKAQSLSVASHNKR